MKRLVIGVSTLLIVLSVGNAFAEEAVQPSRMQADQKAGTQTEIDKPKQAATEIMLRTKQPKNNAMISVTQNSADKKEKNKRRLAALNKKDKFGATYLIRATRVEDMGKVASLLQAGVDVNIGDYGGATALHAVVQQNNTRTLLTLIKSDKINYNAMDNEGYTPLMRAILFSNLPAVQLLAEYSNTYMKGRHGMNAIDLAGKVGNQQMIQYLSGTTNNNDGDTAQTSNDLFNASHNSRSALERVQDSHSVSGGGVLESNKKKSVGGERDVVMKYLTR